MSHVKQPIISCSDTIIAKKYVKNTQSNRNVFSHTSMYIITNKQYTIITKFENMIKNIFVLYIDLTCEFHRFALSYILLNALIKMV